MASYCALDVINAPSLTWLVGGKAVPVTSASITVSRLSSMATCEAAKHEDCPFQAKQIQTESGALGARGD